MIRNIIAMKYANSFNCIGKDCEDTCCASWGIYVDKKAYKKFKKAYCISLENTKKFKANIRRDKNTQDERNYAVLNIQRGKLCPFLSDGLCEIHSNYGSEYLSVTCRHYPRVYWINNHELEINISLSCPEAARQCLLNKDATEIVPGRLDMLPGKRVEQAGILPTAEKEDPYQSSRNDIRHVMMLIASAEPYSVKQRLILLAHFSQKLSAFCYKGTPGFSEVEVQAVVDHISSPHIHEELLTQYSDIKGGQEAVANTLFSVLSFRTDFASQFNSTVKRSVENLSPETIQFNDESDLLIQVLSNHYFERKKRFNGVIRDRAEQLLTNFMRYYLFKSWYVLSDSPLRYIRRLALILNVIVYLTICHPKLNPYLDVEIDNYMEADAISDLEYAMVESCYLTSRAFEHLGPTLMEAVEKTLDESGYNSVEFIAALADI